MQLQMRLWHFSLSSAAMRQLLGNEQILSLAIVREVKSSFVTASERFVNISTPICFFSRDQFHQTIALVALTCWELQLHCVFVAVLLPAIPDAQYEKEDSHCFACGRSAQRYCRWDMLLFRGGPPFWMVVALSICVQAGI